MQQVIYFVRHGETTWNLEGRMQGHLDAPLTVRGLREARRDGAALRSLIEANCDDVGREFPEQARRIHYGETDQRNIYGEASADEASAFARRRHRHPALAVDAPPPRLTRRYSGTAKAT